jgi:ribonuclease HI
MNLRRLAAIEVIDPKPLAPWTSLPIKEIKIETDRDQAIADAKALAANPSSVVYSDASEHQGHLGAAAVILDDNESPLDTRQTGIGLRSHWSIPTAELIGIYLAMELIKTHAAGTQNSSAQRPLTRTIICDSQSALKAILNPSNKAGQHIVHSIFEAATDLQSAGVSVRLQWIPGHCNNPGNDRADRLAKQWRKKFHTHSNVSARGKNSTIKTKYSQNGRMNGKTQRRAGIFDKSTRNSHPSIPGGFTIRSHVTELTC